MRNPLRTYHEWDKRRWKVIRAKGGWFILLHSMLQGLLWGLFMILALSSTDYYRGRLNYGSFTDKVVIFLIGGIIFGIFMWATNFNEVDLREQRIINPKVDDLFDSPF
jgi:hypothetical protein